MRSLSRKAAIIGALLMMLTGCSTLRLGYDNGPTIAWWWLDGYMDFDATQSPRAKDAVRQWFTWHRRTQLPDYALQLASLQAEALEPVTAARACQWTELARERAWAAIDGALPLAQPVLAASGEAQWQHLAQRYAKGNAELRSDFVQPDASERTKASVKRTIERAETFYGRLDERQRRLIAESLSTSPFDPELWLADRERRQREVLQTLRAMPGLDRERGLAALRRLAEALERSPQPDHRAYQQRLTAYNCEFAARLHNATTPAQRQVMRGKLKGWEGDVRALLAGAAAVVAVSP